MRAKIGTNSTMEGRSPNQKGVFVSYVANVYGPPFRQINSYGNSHGLLRDALGPMSDMVSQESLVTDNGATTGKATPYSEGWCKRLDSTDDTAGREKAGWVDELPNVLWAHRTSIKQSNGETPFSLTYGSEAVIPAEIGMPSYRTLMIREEFNEEEQRLNLDLLQERREAAAIREARYKNEQAEWKESREAGPSGKAHTGLQKRSRMALTSCKQWRTR
ncbi:reverse transcriptase domain-containing protein [Tanacetum coccineum]